MRRISANYIFTSNQAPLKNGIVEIDDYGAIINIIDTKGKLEESRNLEFFNGVVSAGFVNSHCHLELSGLKGALAKKQGLPKFIVGIVTARKSNINTSNKDMFHFDSLMKQGGIVAVGDISNTSISAEVKKASKIYYHTFIESMGQTAKADEVFVNSKTIQKQFSDINLRSSIVPHAPYSVSKELFLLIKQEAQVKKSILSIHNQESGSENEMFLSGTGKLVGAFKKLGIDLSTFKKTGLNSISSIIDWLPPKGNIIFVHNTFSSEEDIKLVIEKFENPYWCLCPQSNLNLENKLPDITLFESIENVVLGTDSLASNDTLSIIGEMKTIVRNYPEIEFQTLLKWATINGARALNISEKYGSIEVGKTPGINLISHFDFKKMQLTEKSEVQVLV